MRRSALVCAFLLALTACGKEQGIPPPRPTDTPAQTVVLPTPAPSPTPHVPTQWEFDVDNALAHDRALSEKIGFRETGTPGDKAAAVYIAGELRKIGLQVREQAFPLPKGGTSSNVIGTPPGWSENKPYLIVGGHRDSLRGPGANDNGTGVSVSLEVARALSILPAKLPVLFVAFGAEEIEPIPSRPHHVGSKAYVAAMSDAARHNLVAFLNIDMVGRGNTIHCPRMPTGSREGADRCARIARSLGYTVSEEVYPNYSDHGTFTLANMNAGWIWAGDDLCCYHSPRDTMARIQPDEVERAGRVALAFLRSYPAG